MPPGFGGAHGGPDVTETTLCHSLRPLAVLLAALCLAASAAGQTAPDVDRFGGLREPNFGPGKFFRTHHDGERWWLVTPDGGAFLSMGVCVVNPVGDAERGTDRHPYGENVLARHGSVEKWTESTLARFREWGVNTLGNWSGRELRGALPHTVELGVGAGLWGPGRVPDFFSPETAAHIRERASAVDEHKDDPWLIGYYLDNELPWARDWRGFPDLFDGYLMMPASAPGKQRLVDFLRERHGTPERISAVWAEKITDWAALAEITKLTPLNTARAREDVEAFTLLAAREYFKTAAEALRAKDPDHLLLGCRFVWALAPRPVAKACGEFCDVVTVNYYELGPVGKGWLWLTDPGAMRPARALELRSFHEWTGKPLMVTEFGFRGMDSGLPNSFPPGWLLQPTVPTQKDRADKFEQCVTAWLSQPYFVGCHWFQHMDEPKAGRFDGENGNYGVVDIHDEPHAPLVERFTAVNRRVWDLHKAAK